ncbi:MAG: hypothetical protein ABR498_08770 [Candidatus Dormibacteria bacterium]
MSGAIPLALTPAPLLVALVIAAATPRRNRRLPRVAALTGLPATLALLLVDALTAPSGGRLLASFGDALPGIPYLMRGDHAGVLVAGAAVVAALLIAVQAEWDERRRWAALITCVLGSVVASLAGNAVLLFAGLEVSNVGAFALMAAGRRQPARAAVATLVVEHVGALLLLAAAANLQANSGTSDFSAVPAGAITVAVAVPWALAATLRLLAPALAPLPTARVTTASWAATAAIPTGAVCLLRLREVLGPAPALSTTLTLAIAGGGVALWAASVAISRRSSAPRVGRALVTAVAGLVIAVSGLALPVAAAAIAAGFAALQLAVAMSPAWEAALVSPARRGLAAATLLLVGGFPLGFAATAVTLEFAAVVEGGRVAIPFAIAVMLATVMVAVAAALSARGVFAQALPRAEQGRRLPSLLAAGAGLLSLGGAIVPGAAVAWLAGALGAPPGILGDIGAAGVAGPTGGWAGGYVVVAALFITAAGVAAAVLGGWTPAPRRPADASPLAVPPPLPLAAYRVLRRRLHYAGRWVPAVDGWLGEQPQLPLLAAGSLVAILLIR